MTDVSGKVLHGYGMTLEPVREAHLELLRRWRNDPVINQFMLTKQEITSAQQIAWFKRLANIDSQQHFVICYKNTPIGAANIKEQQNLPIMNLSQREKLRLEPGLYLGEEKFRNNVLAFVPSLLLMDYCFEQLMVQKLYATVHEDNQAALTYNQKLGYRIIASRDGWISIELHKHGYDKATAVIKQFLSKRTQTR